ncbi:Ig-like domain-containing protein [Robertkochia aurantiaca]|uniref:Ig-like domain-containing protein n=1 Tax=Robertkochia aurantiaca TaxID=2873700 RepID=UPI001CC8F2D3|nr:Ig-like domain-containing protein [Robertkochia sp. 3YJGBD-33]
MKNAVRILSLIALLVCLPGCSSGSDNEVEETAAITVTGASINEVNVSGSPEDVPLNTSIEMNFSTAVDHQTFENALSITDPTGSVPFTVTYSNGATRANIALSGLQPLTAHNLRVDNVAIGAEGERLQQAYSIGFTTTEGTAYSTCTTASADCLRTLSIEVDGTPYEFQYYSNYDIESDPEFVWEGIENLILVTHGQNRDADNYFRIMNQAVSGAGLEGNTLVVAPYFREQASAAAGQLYWGSNWRFGGNASNAGTAVSSFSVADALITALTDTNRFPDMNTVFVTGHSSGASFSHYYSLASTIDTQISTVNFEYSALNSQYYFYATNQRYDEGANSWYEPAGCAGFNSWPYGYEFAPSYLDGTEKNAVVQRMSVISMNLFLGGNDTSTTGTLNTDDCGAVLLGSNRLERGRNYDNYLNTYFPNNISDFTIVPNTGHDAAGMFGSPEFREYLIAKTQ